MPVQQLLPDEDELKAVFVPRFAADLKAKERELWQLSGLEQEYGSYSSFKGTFEASEMVSEITLFLVSAILLDVEDRRNGERTGRAVGRPRDVMARDLGPNLLWYFLHYHRSGGRQSVAISVDGKQQEAGPLFEFIKAAIEPLNLYLTENHRKPLSPARLARYALNERRRKLLAKRGLSAGGATQRM